ncbi:MAG: MalT transcriptional regulator family protein, partial [Acidiferrobacteraceae bacterium]
MTTHRSRRLRAASRRSQRPVSAAAGVAKIHAPGYAKALSRPRLFRGLDRSRRAGPVWVAGPPGSGKTTLITSYVANRGCPLLWYRFDQGDEDPATFFHYLGLAARRASPRSRRRLPTLTPGHLPGLEVFARHFFESVAAMLPPSCLCVFENFQDMPASSRVTDVLGVGFDALRKRPGLGIVVVSREDPPAVLASRIAKRAMIGAAELMMTRAETRALARLNRVALAPVEVDRLHATSHGWVAGLTLLLNEHSRLHSREDLSGTQIGQPLFDYFSREIFDAMPAATRELLLATALLPTVTADIAESVTGSRGARDVLADLGRSGYFTTLHSGRLTTYEYHPLFRTFLRRRAAELLSPERINEVRCRAAALLEAAGEIESAANLLREASDFVALAGLCERAARTLLDQGRGHTLSTWITGLPQPVREQSPWLLYWLAVTQQPVDPARELFAKAFSLFRAQDNARGQFLCWAQIAHCYFLLWDEYVSSDHWLAVHDDLRERYRDEPLADVEPQVMSGLVALLVFRQPYHPGIGAATARLAALIERMNDAPLRIRIAGPLL